MDHHHLLINYLCLVDIASTCSGRDEAEDEHEGEALAAMRPALLRTEATLNHRTHLRRQHQFKVKSRIHFSKLIPGLILHLRLLQDLPAPGNPSEPHLLGHRVQLRHGPTTDVSTTSFNAHDSRWRSTWRRACPKADQEECRRWLQLVAALIALLPKELSKTHHHRQQQPQQHHH